MINLFRQEFNVSVCSAQRKIFVITCVFDTMQFDNLLHFFLIAAIVVHVMQTRIIKPFTHWTFSCSKSTIETLHQGWKLFKVNNKHIRKMPNVVVLASLLLTLTRLHILFYCFYCWIWTGKCRLRIASQNKSF